ncbi:hypothetical protein [Streptomyces clavuligerus]|nr:hypothetical protein [Streptomyces clavuligerus]EDY48937.1 CalU6 [Streptomyces clavuligerus]MBY6307478.1 hypothetical protein [Streptomyces clavuligerus]QCS09962.1 hypothetical protein CRV15_30720 [Streptomyces clavuligerus]QPJ97993.1 hypothetical protein GE265_33715 [Streptomyces clavuligerus]WDN56668.1 hypothetical protein LL058_33165 [Streptomyces clavuligerus]
MSQTQHRRPSTAGTDHPDGARPAPGRSPSFFFNGHVPRRRGLVAAVGALFGFALTVIWSHQFVDRTVAGNVAGFLLGHDAEATPIGGVLAGAAFALATGVAGTFTACNIAVFSALGPLAGQPATRRGRMAATLRPLALMAVGAVAVSAGYGVVVALVGTGMPQFDESVPGAGGFSGRLIQAMVVYGVLGAVLIWFGLAALGVVRDPVARLTERLPAAPMLLMGALIGAFLIGRPFPLFRKLFRDAAESGNVLYGAAAFGLQALGNLVVMGVVLLLVAGLLGERLHRWFAARPSRSAAVMAASMLAAGVFMVLYWDVRIFAMRDMIWYPLAPWVR